MLVLFWAALVVVGLFLVLALPAIFGWQVFSRYRAPRTLICPETDQDVRVRVDARYAASTALLHGERLRLSSCSRWPTRKDCDQACVVQILAYPEFPSHIRPVRWGFVMACGAAVWAVLGALAYSPPGRKLLLSLGMPQSLLDSGYELAAPALLPFLVAVAVALAVGFTLQHSGGGLLKGALTGAVLALIVVGIAVTLLGGGGALAWMYATFGVVGATLIGGAVGKLVEAGV